MKFRVIHTIRSIDPLPLYQFINPALCFEVIPQTLDASIDDVFKSNIDYYSSNEKGRTQRMAKAKKVNQQQAKQMEAEQRKVQEKKALERAAKIKPLLSKKQLKNKSRN